MLKYLLSKEICSKPPTNQCYSNVTIPILIKVIHIKLPTNQGRKHRQCRSCSTKTMQSLQQGVHVRCGLHQLLVCNVVKDTSYVEKNSPPDILFDCNVLQRCTHTVTSSYMCIDSTDKQSRSMVCKQLSFRGLQVNDTQRHPDVCISNLSNSKIFVYITTFDNYQMRPDRVRSVQYNKVAQHTTFGLHLYDVIAYSLCHGRLPNHNMFADDTRCIVLNRVEHFIITQKQSSLLR